jgi:hypothetical protein
MENLKGKTDTDLWEILWGKISQSNRLIKKLEEEEAGIDGLTGDDKKLFEDCGFSSIDEFNIYLREFNEKEICLCFVPNIVSYCKSNNLNFDDFVKEGEIKFKEDGFGAQFFRGELDEEIEERATIRKEYLKRLSERRKNEEENDKRRD